MKVIARCVGGWWLGWNVVAFVLGGGYNVALYIYEPGELKAGLLFGLQLRDRLKWR